MIQKITLNMVVRNEEHRIGPTLAMVKPLVDRMIVIDQSSTDWTPKIALSMGAEVYKDPAFGFCEPSRRVAAEETDDDSWILILDADEMLMPEFIAEMRQIDEGGYEGVEMIYSTWVGGECQGLGDPHFRFGRKQSFRWPVGLHRGPDVLCSPSKIYRPKYPAVLHAKTWEEHMTGEQTYAAVCDKRGFPEELKNASTVNLRRWEALRPRKNLDRLSMSKRRKLGFGMVDQGTRHIYPCT